LYDPALSALFLDLAPEAHKGRVMGVKSTLASLGSLAGPALVVAIVAHLRPQGLFLISLTLVGLVTLLAGVLLRVPGEAGRARLARRPSTP
jgi:MFS family permease